MTDTATFIADLADLVSIESPTPDSAACQRALDRFIELGVARTGMRPDVMMAGGRTHALLRASGEPRVLLLGHIDTVWPTGTLARWPFEVHGDLATGPGVFDMKAGLVMGLHALGALDDPSGVGVLVTSDEETGSKTSAGLIQDVAKGYEAVLVLEPSAPGGAVKHARKGVSMFRARITGRAAHAGLEPHKGVNALVELAAQVPAVAALGDTALGTTVTPTVANAGTTINTVPAEATFRIDVRAALASEQERVRAQLEGLVPTLEGAEIVVDHMGTRPPLEAASSASLLNVHTAVCERLGVTLPPASTSGGGSDGNFTAGMGVPTLDGLGGVGDGAHAEGEHVMVEPTMRGLSVLTALLGDLTATKE